MVFKIIQQNYQDASYYKKDDVDFLLEEDRWNDYSYCTQYHLHATARLTGDRNNGAEYLGPINIMKLGQTTDDIFLLRRILGDQTFTSLPEGFYSMTTSISLFESLHRLLNAENRKLFIDSMRLILSNMDEYYEEVKDDECFQISLLRWTKMDGLGLQTGRNLLLDDCTVYNLRRQKLRVRLNGTEERLIFNFSPLNIDDIPSLPNGTIAFIGKNGAGKSSALYRIAALMYSNLSERKSLEKTIGKIRPEDITMSRLLMFSYNPFDSFLLPGQLSRTDLLQWARKVSDRSGRFIFCGFRDVEKEAKILLERQKSEQEKVEAAEDNEKNNDAIKGNLNHLLLDSNLNNVPRKPISALSSEAHDAYKVITGSVTRRDLWYSMIQRLQERHEELYEIIKMLSWADDGVADESWSEIYGRLSTGHQFFVHAMTHAFAYCKRNSLVMFDEPENHLQWPLLGFMMQELRLLLAHWSSVMFVATHSPVILQDMISENIRIVRRVGDTTLFQKPGIETYCESFGEISTEVFDLTPDRVFFFDALRSVFDKLDCDGCESAAEAVDRIKELMGNLSIQAVHYIVQLWMSSNNKD